ncbi:hypothetical protein IWW48_004128 [Coemansia sp. RSA 1200]|nr:hypothetical protein IWW48_004128 [Coemansia sp. RSA 1200]
MDVAEATAVDTVAATDAGAISAGNNGYGNALDGMYGDANGSGGGPCLSIGGDNNLGYDAPTTSSSYPSALCVQSLQLSLDASSPPNAYASFGAGDEFAAEQKIPVVSFISGSSSSNGGNRSNGGNSNDVLQSSLRGRRGRKRKHPEALELISTITTTTSGNSNGAGAGSGGTTSKRKQQQKRNPPATQEEEREDGERGPKRRRRRRTGNTSNDSQGNTHPLQHTSTDSSTLCAGATKSRYRLNNDQKRCFYQWLVKNIDNPYPQETDRNSDLAIEEISKQRFKWWFSNHRHRSLQPVEDENGVKKFVPRLAFYKTCAKLGVEIDWEIPPDIRAKLNAMGSTTTR